MILCILLLLPSPTEAFTMPKIRIKGATVDRDIDMALWRRDIAEMKQIEDENLARLAAISTIFEGNGLPLGITKNQDVAARRLSPAVAAQIGRKADKFGRISLDGVDKQVAKMAILQEKIGVLEDNGKEATPAAVMTKFSGEKGLKARSGKEYVEWLSEILQDIALTPGNEEAKKMMGSLLMPNSRDRR